MDAVETQLLQFLKDKFGGNPTLDLDLVALGVDSLGMAELTLDLERAFSVHVDDGILDVVTISELADYIRGRQQVNS